MGVRGLTTYVNSNRNVFLQDYFLRDSNLIVDGNSLCSQLYRQLNCFSAFGGDYDKFASYAKRFLKNFRKCNISPYVIFDGSHESRKMKTVYSRLRSKISGASRLDPVTQGSLQIFPLLLRDVFKEVLAEMDIPYTTCEFEADDEIAAMARYLNCPVLSYDSDFFIYNVLYIPFNTLEHKPVKIEEENETRVWAIECKIYKVDFLIDNFGGLKEELLPLLATLLGNDYVEKKVFRKFFSQLKLPKSRTCKNDQQRSIHAIFKWLQNETLDSAIAKILGRLKKNDKRKVYNIIKKSIAGYNNMRCRSLKYFNICQDDVLVENDLQIPDEHGDVGDESNDSDDENSISDASNSQESSDNLDDDDQHVLGLPSWFADGVRNNIIPKPYVNLFTLHLYLCAPQAEDYTDEDAFLCNLPILRYGFDILTNYSHEHCVYVSRQKDCMYQRIFVGREYSIPRPLEVPFEELSDEQLNSYFHHFLKEKLPALDLVDICLLPADFQLYMIAIIWWVSNCNVPLVNIHSLFICYIMLEVIDEKTGSFRGPKYFSNQYSKKIEELKRNVTGTDNVDDDLFLNKNKVQYEDCLIAANSLLKHFEIDDTIRKKPKSYDIRRMHSFAQFQCCLLQFNCLNTLCRNPFKSTKYSKCFNGTFVYNIALKLENKLDSIEFFEQYLRGANTVLKFYKSLCVVYGKCEEKMCLLTIRAIGKKQRRRRKGKSADVDINHFLVQGFESSVML